MEISAPVFDTKHNKLIYAVSPNLRYSLSNYSHINHFLDISTKGDIKGRYICTTCHDPVYAKRGDIKRWHFAHYTGSKCSSKDELLKVGGESDDHKFAKYKLYQLLLEGSDITINGTKCSYCENTKETIKVEYQEGDTAMTELTIEGNYRVDVAIVNDNKIRYIFEILHTSKTKNERPEPWFEIKSSDVINCMGNKIVLQDVKPYWCGCSESTIINKLIISRPKCSFNDSDIKQESKDLDVKYPSIEELERIKQNNLLLDINYTDNCERIINPDTDYLCTIMESRYKDMIRLKIDTIIFNDIIDSNNDTIRSRNFSLINPKELYVKDMFIPKIPDEITNFTNLESVSMEYNQIRIFPLVYGLRNLTDLNLKNNYISFIPNEIRYLTNLKSLNLAHNQINIIPDGITNLSNLITLNFVNNDVHYLPGNFNNLTKLKNLDMSYNKINDIKFIDRLTNLEYLDLCNNNITDITEAFLNLKKLTHLDLCKNDIKISTNLFKLRAIVEFKW